MKQVELDDDVYAFLKDASEIGESASSILRRLLGIAGTRQEQTPRTPEAVATHELSGFPPRSRTLCLNRVASFELYRADLPKGRMPAPWVVEHLDVIEHVGA